MVRSEYKDGHRLFVQAMLTKRIISEAEAKALCRKIFEATQIDPGVSYAEFIATINKELEELDYFLRISHSEQDGEPYLSYVNIKQDAMTELATPFTPKVLAYIRELLNEIVNAENENFAISTTKAIRLGGKVQAANLTQKETQDVLEQLVADKWIGLEHERNVYYIDTRGLAELQDYLREQCGDAIKECTVCLDIVTMGEACQSANCKVRLHRYCAQSQFRNAQQPACPACTTSWSRSNVFGLGLSEL